MEAITKGPAFGDRKDPIVKNPQALHSRTIVVTIMKRELDVYLNTEKSHIKFQAPM
jgi:hypothetical protein